MRLRDPAQIIRMYGFPTRKHHYNERGLAKKHTATEKYNQLNFLEHHTNPPSPHEPGTGVSYHGNRNILSSFKVLKSNDIGDVLPVLTTCQLRSKNRITAQGNRVARKYVSFKDELPLDSNISYYGNVTGWHKYGTPSQEEQHFVYPSTSSPANLSRWSNEVRVSHPPLIRTSTWYPQPELLSSPQPPQLPPVTSTKAQQEWFDDPTSRRGSTRTADIPLESKPIVTIAVEDRVSTSTRNFPTAETTLLKAVKLEDTTILADLLNQDIVEDINASDVSGRTVLSYLVLKCNLSLLEKLLKVPNLDVNKSDNEGNTPLHFSAQAGQVEALSLLLNCCSAIEVDARNIFGFTSLMKAALQGRTKCAKLLLFAGASPTMRDIGRGLRAEQWARYCGRYICADMIEKYARHQLLSKTASYGKWGVEPELGIHFVNGKLQPPAIALQNAINQSYKNSSIKSRLKKAFQQTNSSNWNSNSRLNSFSLVTQLTSAALCVSSPVFPNSSKVSPVVRSLIRPFVIPRIEVTPDSDDSRESSVNSFNSTSEIVSKSSNTETYISKAARRLSYFVKLRKKSYF